MEILKLYQTVAEATNIGIIAYDGSKEIKPEVVEELAKIENIMGLKYSPWNMNEWVYVIKNYSNRFSIMENVWFPGLGHMLGARGYTCTTAEFWPQYNINIWNLLEKHEYKKVQEELFRFAVPLSILLRKNHESGIGGEAAHYKTIMNLLGHHAGPARPPHNLSYNQEQKKQLIDLLKSVGLLPK
jgi:dihydrodipicolinate synthase/N-acetylneuraminate lyase